MYAFRTLIAQPQRLALTVGGIALCVLLMLFLLSIHRGVAVGSIEYVRSSHADLWVLQRHTANILRSTSLLNERHGRTLLATTGVDSAIPILFILGGVSIEDGLATTYFTGSPPGQATGGPPALAAGRNVEADSEIVLDRSFAAKYGFSLGRRLPVKDDTLTVVGISSGTNMFVIQYAFVTLNRARLLAGMPDVVSAYQVVLSPGADAESTATAIRSTLPDVAVYDRTTFLENNTREMESGILPLLFAVALIGAVVLAAILSLVLSVNVLELRREFAVMKALGAPAGFIPGLVVQQALLLASAGALIGTGLFYPLAELVERLAPEISTLSSPAHVALVLLGSLSVSLISSLVPIGRLRHVYPLEVFR